MAAKKTPKKGGGAEVKKKAGSGSKSSNNTTSTKRLSPGVYEVNGKRVQAKSAAEAEKKAGSGSKSSNKTTSTKTSTEQSAADKKLDKDLEVQQPDEKKISETVGRQAEESIKFGEDLADRLNDPNAFGKISTERTQEEKDALDMLKREYENSQTRSAESTLAMERFKAGLEGLNSEEGMALRETARREVDSQFQNQMAQARVNAARSGVRGGAANAQQAILSAGRAKTQGDLEQNLTLQNYGIKQQALQNFGNFVNQTEGREGQQRLAAAGLLAGQQNTQVGRDLDRETFNINQDTNRALNRTQTILGGAGIQAGMYGNERANQLSQENMRINTVLGREQVRQGRQGLDAYQQMLNKMYGGNR